MTIVFCLGDQYAPYGIFGEMRLRKDLEFQCVEGELSRSVLNELSSLNESLFRLGEASDALERFFGACRDLVFVLCRSNGILVGFKIGMYLQDCVFESWRGGVHPTFRRLGIARTLMHMQHDWCRAHGYRLIQTVTNQENVPMISLNRTMGFSLVRIFVNEHGRTKILQRNML